MTGRAVRVCVLAGVCCALVAAGVAFGMGRMGSVADGDAARGRYAQDARLADEAAAGALKKLSEGGGTKPEEREEAPWQVSEPLQARTAEPEPAIGALFSPGLDWDDDHHCSGSVVHSPDGDLVVTAAHCVYASGFRTNLAFVPGYAEGKAPFGVWVPTRIDVDPRWVRSSDPDYDVAFIRVRRPGHPGQRIEDVTGAQAVRFGVQLPAPARLVGYPNDAEQPLGCANTAVAAGSTQLRLDCADVPNGTSGGPVLTAGNTLVGVIGGRDGGGDEATSYSSYFGDGVRELYERAVRG
ncbi:serine protease [Streptomyces sp. NBC_00091]|uniref:trypsin-like serine peptidase n=1 Tax=Streptomyces sp. NBC_00091 TaxID=2975648 RepID=UPI00224F17CA|nr:trypsin-like serine protease [Streptomyces sp. NBC_00091]MCX5375113.1 S1 family peptidase [Streptomyces sp. NBC_00091]